MSEFERQDSGLHGETEPIIRTSGRRVPLVAPLMPLQAAADPAATMTAFAPDRAAHQAAAQPALQAASFLQEAGLQRQAERQAMQRQVEQVQAQLPAGAEQAAVQRQRVAQAAPQVPAVFSTPVQRQAGQPRPSAADHVGLYGYEAHTLQRSSISGFVPQGHWQAVQHRAVAGLATSYLQGSGPVVQRQADFGTQLASLQRLPFGGEVAGVVINRLPAGERPAIQRALDQANEALQRQEQQDAQVEQLHAVQRQLAEHAAQGDQAQVMQRVKARQGSGDPLPAAVQRHLEQGLNADLSKVRVHSDTEADTLARQMQAQAFTSGQDIFFRKGLYNPQSSAGFKLLAHEVTHTVQQARGQVGPGVDPDASLEAQAQQMGEQLSQKPVGGDQQRGRAKTPATAAGPQTIQASRGATIQRKLSKLEQQVADALNSPLGVRYHNSVESGDFRSAAACLGLLPQSVQDWVIKNEGSPKYSKPGYLAKFKQFLAFWNTVEQKVGRAGNSPNGMAFTEAVKRGDFRAADALLAKFDQRVRDWLLANEGKAEYAKPAYQAQFQKYLAYRGAASRKGQTLTTQADGMAQPRAGINAAGFIEYKDEGANLRSGPAELPGSRTLTTQPLPNATRVFVSGSHPQKPEWLYVTAQLSGGLVRGYVQNFRVNTQLPEPTATLHEIKDGDQLRPVSGRIYHQDVQPGRDLRFYEEAVLYVNGQAGRNGAYRGGDGSVHLMAGKRIWLVSPAFANSLQGKVASGSITGGLVAQAKEAGRHLQDVLAAVTEFPAHFGEVAGEYAAAIMEHKAQILGVLSIFLLGEAASAFLASTPTGVGQLAAAAIQLGLAAWGAQGTVEAAAGAIPHAEAWLTTAWKANGDPTMIAEAAKSVGRMVVQIALAAMALLGTKGNLGKGLKLADGVKITPPRFQVMQTADGPGVAVPVFTPGSIEAVGAATTGGPSLMTGAGLGGNEAKPDNETPQGEEPAPLSNKDLTPEQAEALLKKTKNWDQLKEYVGKPANQADPPPGYFYRTKNGKLELVRKNAQSGDYAPLTIESGLVVLKSGGSNRISIFSRYKGNYLKWVEETQGKAARTATEARVAGGNQLHHLIPDAVARGNDLVREALARVKGYTIDRGTNILDMPVVRTAADDIMHQGSHPKFNTWVEGQLNRALLRVTKNRRVALDQVEPAAIDNALRGVEDFIRTSIKDRTLPPEILKELEAGGMKLSFVPGKRQEGELA